MTSPNTTPTRTSHPLDWALAEAVAEDRLADALRVVEWMQHRDLLPDSFWAAWDDAVHEIGHAFDAQETR